MGRQRELAAVEACLDRAQAGCALLVLAGEPGIGKTTLWHQGLRLADGRGLRVMSCRPAQTETTLAFAALGDLLAGVPDEVLQRLPEPQCVALQVALLRVVPPHGTLNPRTVGTAVVSLLNLLAESSPVVVGIDDVQWLDRASAGALGFALRRVDARVAALMAERTDGDRWADVLGLGTSLPDRMERVRLGGMSLSALYHVIHAQFGVVPSRLTLQRIAEASAGNPLLAIELTRALDEVGERVRPGEPLPVSASISSLLQHRIAKLPGRAREALLVAALLPAPSEELIERAIGEPVTAALERAARAGIIDLHGRQVRFTHPLLAATVSSATTTAARRSVHRRLVALCDDPEEQARHLALATVTPDETVATRLERGAALARSRGAWASAGELLEWARDLTPVVQAEEIARRSIAAADHYEHAGDRARAQALLDDLRDDRLTDSLRTDSLALRAELRLNDENFDEAARLLTEALEYAQDPRQVAPIELGLVFVQSNRREWEVAATHAQRALEAATATGDPLLLGAALVHVEMMEFLCGRGIDWRNVERSRQLDDESEQVVLLRRRPTVLAALLSLYAGWHAEAREQLTSVVTTARAQGYESDLPWLLLWLSWLETRAGNLSAAADLAEDGVALAAMTESASMHAWVRSQRAYVHAHRGEALEARKLLEEPPALIDQFGSGLVPLWVAASTALLQLSLGDAQAAWLACEPLVESLERDGIGEPVPLFFLPDAIEALIVLGQLDRASPLIDELERCGRKLDRAWALATGGRSRGLLLSARGEHAAAMSALERALDEHDRLDMPFERARTLLVLGQVQRRHGARRAARQSLNAALEVFDAIGARLWAERGRAELARLPMRQGSGDDLTPGEKRVAELVALGRTNQEAAQALFVSEKTVEANLTRIYRKLGVRSRSELSARLRAVDAASDEGAKL